MDLRGSKSIQISDKKFFDDYFQRYPSEISELSFTNLYLWRNYYDYLYLEYQNHLIVYSATYFTNWKVSLSGRKDTLFFLPPIGPNPSKTIINLFENLENIEIHRVPDYIIDVITKEERFKTSNLEVLDDRDSWDYIYQKEDLINLPGNKFRQKRRWLNKFFEQYNYEFHIINEDLVDKTLQLQLKWCDANECQGNVDLEQEQKAIVDALEHYIELDINGGIIFVDGKCVAYTLGEMLNKETLVIHIEKSHIDYEGSYQAINNLFLKEFGTNAKYVNREQDLGIEGLRRAKEAYKPIKMVKKSIIYRKL